MNQPRRAQASPSRSLFRTKSIEETIADAAEPGRQLKRSLSAWDLMILGVAVAVGAGRLKLFLVRITKPIGRDLAKSIDRAEAIGQELAKKDHTGPVF